MSSGREPGDMLAPARSTRQDEVAAEVVEHLPRLRAYARSLTRLPEHGIDELVQQTALRAITRAHLLEPGTKTAAWLIVMLRNIHYSNWRRERCQSLGVEADIADLAATDPRLADGGERAVLARVELAATVARIARLPRGLRAVAELILLESESYEGAARRLRVSVGTIKSRVHRARAALAQDREGGDCRAGSI